MTCRRCSWQERSPQCSGGAGAVSGRASSSTPIRAPAGSSKAAKGSGPGRSSHLWQRVRMPVASAVRAIPGWAVHVGGAPARVKGSRSAIGAGSRRERGTLGAEEPGRPPGARLRATQIGSASTRWPGRQRVDRTAYSDIVVSWFELSHSRSSVGPTRSSASSLTARSAAGRCSRTRRRCCQGSSPRPVSSAIWGMTVRSSRPPRSGAGRSTPGTPHWSPSVSSAGAPSASLSVFVAGSSRPRARAPARPPPPPLVLVYWSSCVWSS